ncbi:MAG: hypothetical protein HN576_16950 [Bacteriovoracaceae bacterium]|jgi:hypothetical protein|nr:hypothetical protein [Bacteriovoracaceae bacterium]
MRTNKLTLNIQFFSKHCFIFLSFAIMVHLPHDALGKLRNFETTRIKSTAGTGVGSILLDEATLLNPASMGFYTVSSVFFQTGGGQITPAESGVSYNGIEPEATAFIASDASRGTGGSLSYTKQNYDYDSRNVFSASLATPVTKTSTLGITYRNSTDLISSTDDGLNIVEENYSQIIFGFIHALSPNFSIGLVAIDPFQERPEDTRAILGMQYVYKSLSIMFDIGANYNEDLTDSPLYRAATQIQVMNDFYIRFGVFKDEGLKESGNGVGAGWAGPKLVLDLALKTTRVDHSSLLIKDGESIKETSFSLSYKF